MTSDKDREQLVLDFDHRPALSGEDFLIADCNRHAMAWLDRWPNWPTPAIVVFGDPGCGKTHLAQVFLVEAQAVEIATEELTTLDPIAIMGSAKACLVEDVDRLVAAGFERNLLHLYNWAQETKRTVLMTARSAPSRWDIKLADLRSRLQAVPAIEIGSPDDALISAVLVKLFADRQLRVDDDVVHYLVTRIERSFEAARRVVGKIDSRSLKSKRRITLPLVREVLAKDA